MEDLHRTDERRGTNTRPEDTGYLLNLQLEGSEEFLPELPFIFKPDKVKCSGRQNKGRLGVLGGTVYRPFENTENMTVSFKLYMNVLMMIKEATHQRPRGAREGGKRWNEYYGDILAEHRRYLWSLLHPAESPAGIIGSDTPTCILCLPKIVTINCSLMSIDDTVEATDVAGNLMALSCNVTFEEQPLGRITMQDVLTVGMNRTWG